MVWQRGIEANPENIKALLEMSLPKNTKEIQRLIGWVAAPNIFIFKSIKRCLIFLDVIKKSSKFTWTMECQKVFDQLKVHLAFSLLLSSLGNVEEFLVYLYVSNHALSDVLIKEEGGSQMSMYYISIVL